MGLLNRPLLAVADSTTHDILVYNIETSKPIFTFHYHKHPIVGIVFHPLHNFAVSLDKNGTFSYWIPQDGSVPKQFLEFRYLISTDLYLFKKNHVTPMSLSISPNGKYMSVFGLDWKVWI